MLSLATPWLLCLLSINVIIFLLNKKWVVALLLVVVALTLNTWSECIPYSLSKLSGASNCVKIISFNIDGSTGDTLIKAQNVRNFLYPYSADIVFVAEFNEQYPHSLDSLLHIEYAYSTFPDSLFFQYFYGRFPFINSRRLKSDDGEWIGVYACSAIIKGDTLDLYGCHWASNNYNEQHEREEVDNFDGIKNIKNICTASTLRKKEAEAIVREMSKSSHSAIVMGDMNDVGGSPALKILESEGLKDAWWEGGVGYGATIFKPLPYRIDHILFSKGLSLGTISVLDSNGISDHNALFAEFIVE
jgi:hypothetical protein